jgi:hypothetical protein
LFVEAQTNQCRAILLGMGAGARQRALRRDHSAAYVEVGPSLSPPTAIGTNSSY